MTTKILQLGLIAMLGGAGVLCRYGISQIPILRDSTFPFATLLANLLGCLLAGVCAFYFLEKQILLSAEWRNAISIGFLGGLTTFSTFSIESLQLLQSGNTTKAVIYFVASPLLSLLCAFCGLYLARWAL